MMNILIVIPARGGSRGIPRKNLRALGGEPLIAYAIKTAQASSYSPDIYVSSDDEEILNVAQTLGAGVLKRRADKAADATTLDPVIYDAYVRLAEKRDKHYDLVVTMQPTSPLLKTASLDAAVARFEADGLLQTVIAAKDDTHLTWRRKDDRFVPNYTARVNRQYLAPVFKETGAFLITRSSVITPENRIGDRVDLFLLNGGEAIDIDTYEEWSLCEYFLRRKTILFVVSGYDQIGLGHVYNTLLIANDILEHTLLFLVDKQSDLAYEKIRSMHYPVYRQSHEEIVDDICVLAPDIVINDCLDTSREYVEALKAMGATVINFEDLGEGALRADLVINAIYPEAKRYAHHYYGHEYMLLRDEFILSVPRKPAPKVQSVLLTFGGVDPNNYTRKVLEAIYDYCIHNGIALSVVAGLGYREYASLQCYPNVNVYRNVGNMAEHMRAADIIFTSAGRTTYEVAALQVPTIVMAQNEREMTHFFAAPENGFIHLGLGYNISKATILGAFVQLAAHPAQRMAMHEKMAEADLRGGRKRTLSLIKNVLET